MLMHIKYIVVMMAYVLKFTWITTEASGLNSELQEKEFLDNEYKLNNLFLLKNSLLDESILTLLNNMNKNLLTNDTLVVSCNQWRFLKSVLTEAKICVPISKICQKKNVRLLEMQEGNVFLATYHNIIESVVQLIAYWNYENAIFFTDSDVGIEMRDLRKYLRIKLSGVKLKVFAVDSMKNLREKLIDSSRQFLNYIIICNNENTNKIIEMAESSGLFKMKIRWVFANEILPKEFHSTNIYPESQVTLISPNIHAKERQIKDNTDQYPCYQLASKSLKILLNPEERTSRELRQSTSVEFYDVFYSNQTMKTEFVKFAQWTAQKGLSILESLETNDYNGLRLRGRSIRTSSFTARVLHIHLPYVIPTKINGTASALGLNIEVMEMFREYFNAFYPTVRNYQPSWGLAINGTYTGILGVAYRKEVEIPLNGFILAKFRLRIIRYTAPVGKIDMSILYETPMAIVPPTTYAMPFSFSVWISILIVFCCVIIALATVMYFSPSWKAAIDIPSIAYHTIRYRLLTITFFEELLDNVPPGSAAKVIFGTLLVATLSIYVFYTSIFTSVLAYRELKMPIRNLRDLVDNRDYGAMLVKSTTYDSMFRFAQHGLFKDVWDRKMAKNEKYSIQPTLADAVNTMYKGKNVLVTDGASAVASMENNCSISLIKTRLYQEYLFLVTRTDFPYNRMYYMRLLKIKEGGILNRFGKKYMTESRPPCPVESPSLTLGLLQVVGLFFILGCGIVLSLVALIIENIINATKN